MKNRPLLLAVCYLNLLFRESEFITYLRLRSEFRSKAEEFSRKLARKYAAKKRIISIFGGTIDLAEWYLLQNSLSILTIVTYKQMMLHIAVKRKSEARDAHFIFCITPIQI